MSRDTVPPCRQIVKRPEVSRTETRLADDSDGALLTGRIVGYSQGMLSS
jgi:hypothetical protein